MYILYFSIMDSSINCNVFVLHLLNLYFEKKMFSYITNMMNKITWT